MAFTLTSPGITLTDPPLLPKIVNDPNSSKPVDQIADQQHLCTVKDRIVQISSCILIAFGTLFLLFNAGLLFSEILAGTATAALMQNFYPLSIFSLLGVISLLQGHNNNFRATTQLGPLSVTI